MIKEISRKMMSWDSPVFVSHWLTAISFCGAVLTQDGERFRQVHVTMGYTMLGVVAFRIIWGFIGSKYARFSTMTSRFTKVREHIQMLFCDKNQAIRGLQAIGFSAAYLLIFFVLLVSITGYLTFNEIGPEIVSEIHEFVANLLMGLVIIHVGAILLTALYQYLQKKSIDTEKKMAVLTNRVRPYRWLAVMLVSLVVYFWGVQFKILQ